MELMRKIDRDVRDLNNGLHCSSFALGSCYTLCVSIPFSLAEVNLNTLTGHEVYQCLKLLGIAYHRCSNLKCVIQFFVTPFMPYLI